MADQWSGGQTSPQWNGGQAGPGERWNVNLPAVIGVVFVFLVGVIVWVIVASGDDDDGQITTGTLESTIASSTSAPAQTTTPPPMPSTSVVVLPTIPPPASAPVTAPATAPVTAPATAPPIATEPPPPPAPAPPPPTNPPPNPPTNPPTTVAPTLAPPPPGGGDLGVPGHPMQQPPCDGGYITILASAIGDQATADSMGSVIGDYPGSSYLRTDVTCTSLNPSSGGRPIYVVYFGPFATSGEACAARSQGPDDAYVRRLSNDLGPNHSVTC